MNLPPPFHLRRRGPRQDRRAGGERHRRGHHLLVECNDVPGQVGAIGTYLGAKGVNITALEIKPAGPGAILLDLVVSLARTRHSLLEVEGGLAALPGIRRVEEGTGAD